mmetsp:Transcript_24947/g.40052  ORF Transcript_24947/g.40052 Transcript_24947/m.40052 type:complete len:156 (-) Transcript_24947:3-470(-)
MIGDSVLVIEAMQLCERRSRTSRQEDEADVAILRAPTIGEHAPADVKLDAERKHDDGKDTVAEGTVVADTAAEDTDVGGAEATTEATQLETLGAAGYGAGVDGTAFTNGAKLEGCLVNFLKGVATLRGVSILAAGVKQTALETWDSMTAERETEY